MTLARKQFMLDRTIGEMTVDGISQKLYTMEDVVRGNGDPKTVSQWKVKGKTAIPYGTYDVVWQLSPSRQQNTLRLLNVPGYQGILIHSGNTPEDTEGCLLLGMEYDNVSCTIKRSKEAVALVESVIVPLLKNNETVQINIINGAK